MYKDYCGSGIACAECKKRCAVDESIPCSPDCKNLDGSKIKISECLKEKCEEVFYIFGMDAPNPGTDEKWEMMSQKLLAEYGNTAEYPY